MTASLFPTGTSFTPVPNPLFGPILESITDLRELKCVLRALWHINRQKGSLRYVSLQDLTTDTILRRTWSVEAITQAMREATRRGIFTRSVLASTGGATTVYVLNTEADRRALESTKDLATPLSDEVAETEEVLAKAPNIYTLYEANIGLITPLIAENLKWAEQTYPWHWLEEAFKIAVTLNKRNWRYVEAILERWATEGKQDGEFRGHTKALDRKRYLKEYTKRRGEIPGP